MTWSQRMEQWFPEREFFMRSQGQVRFIKISSKLQKRTAALAMTASIAFVGSMGVMSVLQYQTSLERASLMERETTVATSEERLQAYRDNMDEVVLDLNKRQDFIEEMMKVMPQDAVRQESTVTDSESETDELVEKVSSAVPEAAALARIEARQLAFVEGMTRYADDRSRRAMWALRELGLNPGAMLASAEQEARGGPFEALFGGGQIDPRFERLGLSLSRMATLEATLDGVPQLRPTDTPAANSSYGYRRDPFTGRAAMHRGLDFKGPMGAPIYATARGTVTFVGRKGGYGNTVEISHGQGLLTRYAHMSRFDAKVGDRVEAGAVIGAIGSTGRSTGPHLHFEVRVNGTAVNPRTFLELAPDVLKKARRSPGAKRTTTASDAEGGASV